MFESVVKRGEVHVLSELGGEHPIVPSWNIGTERFYPIDFVFELFRRHPSAQVRLYVYGYRRAIKRDFTGAQGWQDIYDEGYRRAYLGTMRRDSDGQYCLRDFLSTRGQTSLLGDSDGPRCPDELKLGWEDAVREVVEACGIALQDGQELAPDFARMLAEFVTRSWREPERRSLETLRRALGDEVADKLLREGMVNVKSRNGREYAITAYGGVSILKRDGSPEHVCMHVEGEERLPQYDQVLAKYLVIHDHPEQISTLREALERCARCGREIRLGDVHGAVTLEEEAFVGGQEGRDYDVDVVDAEVLCIFCNECYRELKSRGAFGRIEELFSGPRYTAVLIQDEYIHEFVGVDMQVYGPFRRGEVACLPRANAELMVRRGEARKLEMLEEGKICPICEGRASHTGTEGHGGEGDGG